ncbi:MAG: hypothetical protein JRN27_00220 [Nitrososphaerota archaeon]|nr:hypothetical protein [Nitrososphaerota archaeon]MDG7009485.1 hypothetical protein [Nitrososphaerota archaeon]MDG7019095.1 hypothetical protein [Nitrososphaerota archaeon]
MAQSSKHRDEDYLLSGESRHVQSGFMKDSLLSEKTKRSSETAVYPLMPSVTAIQIGGRLVDSGRDAILPILAEIRRNLKQHKVIVAAGSGKRAKHVLAVASDLGLPLGLRAELRRLDTELNAHIIGALLSPYGIAELTHAEMVHMLPAMLEISRAVVFNGVPPYDIWEHIRAEASEPPTGADAGVFLFAETCGMKRVVFVRDVDGIYDEDPRTHPSAKLVKRAMAGDMSTKPSSCVDQEVFRLQAAGRHQIDVSVVNGLKKGALSAALRGGNPGTLVKAR